jgi:hypothetical protein
MLCCSCSACSSSRRTALLLLLLRCVQRLVPLQLLLQAAL